MRASVFAPLLALAASVSALQITSPTGNNASIDLSQDTTITWTTVPSDPTTIRLVLVNMSVNPSINVTIAESINTADLKYTVKAQSEDAIKVGPAYQFNFYGKDGQNTGILTQSNQFTVTKVAEKKSTPTTGSGSTPAETSAAASTTAAKSGAEKVGAWGVGGLLVAGAFAALL